MSIIPRSTKIANVCVIFWGFFYCSPSFLYFGGVFNKAIIPLALVGYEMIITNSALLASLAFYHLISARGIIESEMWSSQQIFQFKQLERRSMKKNQGFNGIRTRDLRDTGAMFYQLSYEATHWERGLIFFQASSFQLLKLEHLLRWSHFTFMIGDSNQEQLIHWLVSII